MNTHIAWLVIIAGPSCLGNTHEDNQPQYLLFDLTDYLELVDWTGCAVRDDKRGAIPQEIPPILNWLNLSPEGWLNTMGE